MASSPLFKYFQEREWTKLWCLVKNILENVLWCQTKMYLLQRRAIVSCYILWNNSEHICPVLYVTVFHMPGKRYHYLLMIIVSYYHKFITFNARLAANFSKIPLKDLSRWFSYFRHYVSLICWSALSWR